MMLSKDSLTPCEIAKDNKTEFIEAASMAVSFKSAAGETADDLLW